LRTRGVSDGTEKGAISMRFPASMREAAGYRMERFSSSSEPMKRTFCTGMVHFGFRGEGD
jgi:hypothetical protein